MKKYLLSLFALFLSFTVCAQDDDVEIERMCTFGLVQELDENMEVKQEAEAQGIIVIGTSEGERQIAFAVGEEAVYDLTIIEVSSEEIAEGKLANTYVCKSNMDGDSLLYNVMEFFNACDPDTPVIYLVSGVNPNTMKVESMEQFTELTKVE